MSSLTTEEKTNSFLITLPALLDESLCIEFEKLTTEWIEKGLPLYILDFQNLMKLSHRGVAALVKFARDVRTKDKHLYSINLAKSLLREVTAQGLDLTLRPVDGMKEAYEKAGFKFQQGSTGGKLDAEFLNPFIDAVINTFKVQLNMAIKPGKVTLKKDAVPLPLEIAGVISLASSHFHGTISLGFPGPVFLKVYESWLGEVHTEINQEIQDAAGELLNIIYGQAKAELNKKNYSIEKALPTVVTGEKLKLAHMTKGTAIVIDFTSEHGSFVIEIATN